MTRTQLSTIIHETGKGRKPGERGIPEHSGRGHPQDEVVIDGMRHSPRCQSRERTTEKRLLVFAIKWSLENLLKVVSIK